jgi:hypothetical protein
MINKILRKGIELFFNFMMILLGMFFAFWLAVMIIVMFR